MRSRRLPARNMLRSVRYCYRYKEVSVIKRKERKRKFFIFQFVRNIIYIVAYGPVAKLWLCKQRPLLGNIYNIHAYNHRITVFSLWILSKYYNREFWSLVSSVINIWPLAPDCTWHQEWWLTDHQSQCDFDFDLVQLRSARETVKRGPEGVKLKNFYC
jgi:hypothetical protein